MRRPLLLGTLVRTLLDALFGMLAGAVAVGIVSLVPRRKAAAH